MAKVKTNADRIRSMTDEELLEFLQKFECQDVDYGITFCGKECDEIYTCEQCLKTWLNRPFENNSFWSRDISVKEDF